MRIIMDSIRKPPNMLAIIIQAGKHSWTTIGSRGLSIFKKKKRLNQQIFLLNFLYPRRELGWLCKETFIDFNLKDGKSLGSRF